jgi:plastocyanin
LLRSNSAKLGQITSGWENASILTMIWRWLTLFSFGTLLCQAASTVVGRIDLTVTAGHARDKNQADQSGTVIWLEPRSNDSREDVKGRRFKILQKDKRFTPHVLAIPIGSTVDFPNEDPIFHNAFSNYDGQIFDIGLYPPGTSRTITFRRPGIVRVFCNIHATMSAVIVVLDTPYYAVTNGDGAYRIENVPSGIYRLHLFHERANEQALRDLTRDVTVSQLIEEIQPIHITQTGYLAVTHLNKYGKPYQPTAADPGTYPGAKQ